jgi:hypothetical protein
MDRMHPKYIVFVAAVLFSCVLLTGCQKEEIQSYLPPTPVEMKAQPELREGPRQRMLAAVIPHDDENWFLKLQGPEQAVTAHKAEFDEVLRTFHFVDKKNEPAEWTTPKGWTRRPQTEQRYATLELDDQNTPLEISVTRLAGGGMIVPNVNRWRKQLGLNPVAAMDLHKVTTQVKIAPGSATMVDLVGVSDRAAAMPRDAAHAGAERGQAARAPASKPFEYTLPAGWTPMADKGGAIRTAATFVVTEGAQEALVTVTQLQGRSGSLAMNIDRWRTQLGLPPGTPEELKTSTETTVGGIRSPFIDLTGPKTDGRDPKRMLVAIVTQGDATWYFKMLGSADLVGRQKSTFEAFMSSVRFSGGPRG